MKIRNLVVAALVSGVSLTAFAQPGPRGEAGFMPFGGPGMGWFQGPGGHGVGGEKFDERIDRMTERFIKRVEGTPEQSQRLAEIAKAAARDLGALGREAGDLRRQAVALLKAPTIDRAGLEALRVKQSALADQMSKRRLAAMADSAEVLTPEQRAKVAERFEKRRQHRHERGGERSAPANPPAKS